jgi:hypothetical protein
MTPLFCGLSSFNTTIWPEASMRVRHSGSYDLPYDPPPPATTDIFVIGGEGGDILGGEGGDQIGEEGR